MAWADARIPIAAMVLALAAMFADVSKADEPSTTNLHSAIGNENGDLPNPGDHPGQDDDWEHDKLPLTVVLNPDRMDLSRNLAALRASSGLRDVVGCATSGAMRGTDHCRHNGDWLHRAVEAAEEALVDPRVVLARILIEMHDKISRPGYGRLSFIRDSHAKLDLYESGLYGCVAWLFGKNGKDGPSLGVGDMKNPVFELVKARYPDKFGAQQFRDLINNDALGIRMVAHYYRYIRDEVLPTMSTLARMHNMDRDLIDIYYWKGPKQSEKVTASGGIDYLPRTKKHVEDVAKYRQIADELVCHSGVYLCR